MCDVEGALLADCQPGVLDCCALGLSTTSGRSLLQCANYNNELTPPGELGWLAWSAFATMALMSFGIGANDAANSWGTSIGAGAISLQRAVLIGGLMDWLGAASIGAGAHHLSATSAGLSTPPRGPCLTRMACAGVSNTIRKDVTDIQSPECWACGYCDSRMSLFMLGMAAALLATAVFLILSSVTAMPVSTTHAVVGAVVGMTAAATSTACLQYWPLARIAASWLLSPLLAGVIAVVLYRTLLRLVIHGQGAPLDICAAVPTSSIPIYCLGNIGAAAAGALVDHQAHTLC